MGHSTSRLAYSDCQDFFDQSIEEGSAGIRIRCESKSKAEQLRVRLHYFRRIDREDNIAIYKDEPDHPMHGRSAYDKITVRMRKVDDSWWLYLEQNTITNYHVEKIDELNRSPDRSEGETERDREEAGSVKLDIPSLVERITRRA